MELKHRAIAAYYRALKHEAGEPMQPSVTEVTHNGLDYIVLHNKGVLAVYRVRTVNGQPVLKGLKRWPAALNGV